MTVADIAPTRVPTPCIRVCVLDPKTDLCRGCFRSKLEIAGWLTMSQAQRAAVNELAEERKAEAEAKRFKLFR